MLNSVSTFVNLCTHLTRCKTDTVHEDKPALGFLFDLVLRSITC